MNALLARLSILNGLSGDESLRLRRSWPRGDDRLLLEYTDSGGATVAGQWHADRQRGKAVSGATPGATWLPQPGVVLQPDGADRRLPAIARLMADPGAALIVHRPERRAVIRRPGPTYAKVVPPARAAAVLAADRAARDTGAVLLPELLAADLDAGVLEWAELPGRALYDLLLDATVPVPDLTRAGTATGLAVRALHDAAPPVGVAHHPPAAEVDVAARWVRLAIAFTTPPPGVDRALREAASLLAGAPTSPVLVHRDLHEKQVLIDGDRAGLLDIDTLAQGEAAVDLANLLVHLDLGVALGLPPERSRAVAKAFLDAYQPASDVVARIPAYAASTSVRLACVYAFRPAERAYAARLIATPTSASRRAMDRFDPCGRRGGRFGKIQEAAPLEHALPPVRADPPTTSRRSGTLEEDRGDPEGLASDTAAFSPTMHDRPSPSSSPRRRHDGALPPPPEVPRTYS